MRVLESGDYCANQVHLGAQVASSLLVRITVSMAASANTEVRRLPPLIRCAARRLPTRTIDLQPRGAHPACCAALSCPQVPIQGAPIWESLVQIPGPPPRRQSTRPCVCVAGKDQVIDGLAEHLVYRENQLCGFAM